MGDELMQYISKSDFRQCDSIYVKISKEILDREYVNWLDSSKRIIGTLYCLTDIPKLKLNANPLRFKGSTYLLIGGKTFSAATDLASAFKCYNAGRIIGTETGGLTASFGDVYTFELPNTKLNVGVSYKKFINACGKDDGHGVIPDYIIKNSFEDDKKDVDKVLEFTIHLINQEK